LKDIIEICSTSINPDEIVLIQKLSFLVVALVLTNIDGRFHSNIFLKAMKKFRTFRYVPENPVEPLLMDTPV
jgi:hypothetical protein